MRFEDPPVKPKIGRPPIPVEDRMMVVAIRMTEEHRAKLARLGGGGWVRKKIERAREPRLDEESTK